MNTFVSEAAWSVSVSGAAYSIMSCGASRIAEGVCAAMRELPEVRRCEEGVLTIAILGSVEHRLETVWKDMLSRYRSYLCLYSCHCCFVNKSTYLEVQIPTPISVHIYIHQR